MLVRHLQRKYDPDFKTLREVRQEKEKAERTAQEALERGRSQQTQTPRAILPQRAVRTATTSAKMRSLKRSTKDGDFPGGIDPIVHHQIGQSREDPVRIYSWLAQNEDDPAIEVCPRRISHHVGLLTCGLELPSHASYTLPWAHSRSPG